MTKECCVESGNIIEIRGRDVKAREYLCGWISSPSKQEQYQISVNTYDSESVSIDLSLPHDAVSRIRLLTAVLGRKLRRPKRINLNNIYSLLGVVLPPLPHFTHISLTATVLAQTLAHVASSTGRSGLSAALVDTSSLHCLSPKISGQIESQHEL